MIGTRYYTRCMLGAHLGLMVCLCLGMATAQPTGGSKNVEELLLARLSDVAGGGNAFKSFVQRAQLVITGLMHISILLLPRAAPAPPAAPPPGKPARGGKSASGAGASSSAAASEGPTPGFPADGSDLATWARVRRIVDRQSSSGMDWGNCCMYGLTEGSGATVQPQPPYPVGATAAYHAAVGKKEALICNDYDVKGPHFADWRALRGAGARSMAAAPMYCQDTLVGVLSLASSEPHAFARSRVVWLLALLLAPLAAGLRYASQALRMEALVLLAMPSLLEQNYLRNTSLKRKAAAAEDGAAGSGAGGRPAPSASASASGPSKSSSSSSSAGRPGSAVGAAGSGADGTAAAGGAAPPGAGGRQFAEQAEVLIASAARGGELPNSGGGVTAPPLSPATHAPTPTDASTKSSPAGPPNGRAHGDAALVAPPLASSAPAAVAVAAYSNSAPAKGSTAAVHSGGVAASKVSVAPTVAPRAASAGAATAPHPSAGDPYLAAYDSDLDWGDFFFNLVSMCIVYAYFSEAAVAGENQAAVVVSMIIAAVDIVLLGLRWLWYEQYITYGGAVLQVFQMYRLIVLPVANTWMSWSLLNKLGVRPGGAVVATLGAGVGGLLLAGTRVRSLLHAPLQLASVLFAAASTTHLCTLAFGSATGLRCMGTVSLLQLSLGVAVPSVMVHLLDLKVAGGKRYLPHVQAKRWLVHQQ